MRLREINSLQVTILVLLAYQLILIAAFAITDDPFPLLDPLLGVGMFRGEDNQFHISIAFSVWLAIGVIAIRQWPRMFLALHTLIALPNLVVLAMFFAAQGFHAPNLWECLIMLTVFAAFFVLPIAICLMTKTEETNGLVTLF